MLFFYLFFIPAILFVSSYLFEGYNPSYYENHSRFVSQNGINLNFIKMNENQWNYFLKNIRRYFIICSILSLTFNVVYDLWLFPGNENIMFANFLFGLFLAVIAIMIIVTRAKHSQ